MRVNHKKSLANLCPNIIKKDIESHKLDLAKLEKVLSKAKGKEYEDLADECGSLGAIILDLEQLHDDVIKAQATT